MLRVVFEIDAFLARSAHGLICTALAAHGDGIAVGTEESVDAIRRRGRANTCTQRVFESGNFLRGAFAQGFDAQYGIIAATLEPVIGRLADIPSFTQVQDLVTAPSTSFGTACRFGGYLAVTFVDPSDT